MTMEHEEAEERERRIADPLLEEIASWTPAESRPVRPREYDRIADNLDAAIQEWLKHHSRCDLIVEHTTNGDVLTSTRQPSPTSRPAALATAIQVSLCEALAELLADELLATVRPILANESYSRLRCHATALLLELLPFGGPLELILESVPAIHHILLSIQLLMDQRETEEQSTEIQQYCRRRARAKLKVKSRRSKSDMKLSVDIDEVVRRGNSESAIPPNVWAFLIRFLEWLKTLPPP